MRSSPERERIALRIPKHERMIMAFAERHQIDTSAAYDLVDAMETHMRWVTSRAEQKGFRHGVAIATRGQRRSTTTGVTRGAA